MKMAGFILLQLNAPRPPLHLHHHHLSFPTQPFLYISPSLSSLCHHQSTVPWSRVFPSPYHLLFLHYSTSSSSSLSTTSIPAITEITTLHSYITIPLTFSLRLLISRHCHRPLALHSPVFIILIITLIISPTVPEAQYLYVLDVLYSINAVC